MTRTEQRQMTHYAQKHGYTVWGVHNEQSGSYGLRLDPPQVIYWDAASMKQRIDDRERQDQLYQEERNA